MTRTEKENLVPVWERITISLEEAAAYSGIGVRKLRDMTDKPECNYVIWVGNRRMIKRKKFDETVATPYQKGIIITGNNYQSALEKSGA